MHKGDNGSTTSTCGMCVAKDSKEVMCIAALDHLVSLVGKLRKEHPSEAQETFRRIQEDIYKCINHIYGSTVPQVVINIEVDWLNSFCGPFEGFDYPGDNFWGVTAHECRTWTRVCECKYAGLEHNEWQSFLNRLSSFFYTLAIKRR